MTQRPKWLGWVVLVTICVAIVAALGMFKYTEIRAAMARGAAFPEQAAAVQAATAQAVEHVPAIAVTGELLATQSATLRTEERGRIVEVGFEPGARVHAGDVLLRLDVSQEEAQLAETRANKALAALALERAKRLVDRGAGSVEARDQAQAQFDAASARERALLALIAKKTLTAPFDALTGLHQLERGQYLESGASVTQLIGITDALWVDFALPQAHTGIRIGSTVVVTAEELRAPLTAEVIAADAQVDAVSRSLRVRAVVDVTDTPLLPGMLVEVQVAQQQPINAVAVPATAIRYDALGSSVYVISTDTADGKPRAVRQPVTLVQSALRGSGMQSDGERALIRSGLAPGATVATIGAFKLREGMLVQIVDAPADVSGRLVGH